MGEYAEEAADRDFNAYLDDLENPDYDSDLTSDSTDLRAGKEVHRKKLKCKYCGNPDVQWGKDLDGNWRLYLPGGKKQHECATIKKMKLAIKKRQGE